MIKSSILLYNNFIKVFFMSFLTLKTQFIITFAMYSTYSLKMLKTPVAEIWIVRVWKYIKAQVQIMMSRHRYLQSYNKLQINLCWCNSQRFGTKMKALYFDTWEWHAVFKHVLKTLNKIKEWYWKDSCYWIWCDYNQNHVFQHYLNKINLCVC